jgi:PTS system galactitol-specific IIA component
MAGNDPTFEIFFKKELIFRDVDWKSSSELFQKISTKLEQSGYVAPTFYRAISRREQEYPTGLQTTSLGAAIPHTDPMHIKKPFIAVIRPAKPILFAQMGGDSSQKVSAAIIFILGVMRNGLQVKVLQKLMGLLSDRQKIQDLMTAVNNMQILNQLKAVFTNGQQV